MLAEHSHHRGRGRGGMLAALLTGSDDKAGGDLAQRQIRHHAHAHAHRGGERGRHRCNRLTLAHTCDGGISPAAAGELIRRCEDPGARIAAQRGGWEQLHRRSGAFRRPPGKRGPTAVRRSVVVSVVS